MRSIPALLPLALGLPFALSAAPPTFAHDIAPLFYKECAPCHRPGESGPFSLLTYADVKKRAPLIAQLTRTRAMPPWLPAAGSGNFADSHRLTDEQIQMVSTWVANGAPEGPSAETPPPPQFTDGWQLGPPDLILRAEKPLTVPAAGLDVYWNFVFKTGITTRKYVRAIEIRPGQKRLVHHANLYVDFGQSARRQEKSPGEGFPGMEPTIERPVSQPDEGHFLYWKPGGLPYSEPPGLSWALDPGSDLVLNTHVQPSGKVEHLQPEVGLYFTDEPPKHFPMLLQLEHDGALNIPAGAANFVVTDHLQLPVDVDVLAIYPHAHYLGRVLEAYATLPDGTRKPLIRIPDWNPSWESVYRYKEPVFLPKGSVISMRFTYDNSAANTRNPHHPLVTVHAGNRVLDEMSHLWLQVLPRGDRDRRRELEEALMRRRLEKYPADLEAHARLGAILLSRLDAAGAITMLTPAVRMAPAYPDLHNLLGSAYQAVGRTQDAVQEFRTALKLRPDFINAHLNLGLALARLGQTEEAIVNLRQVVAAYPDESLARERLILALAARARQLTSQGQTAPAAALYDEILKLDPENADARKLRDAIP